MAVLRSLNGLRVLAEFWVVHLHFIGASVNPSLDAFITSLMSFFFVLSGFVVTHAHREGDMSDFRSKRQFLWRRFSKLYPTFLFFWAVDFAYVACSGEFSRNPKDLVCHLMQLPMLSSWIGCGASISNPPSWYVIGLWWFWFVFPWLIPVVRRVSGRWPWAQILALNAVSFVLVAGMIPIGYWSYASFPPVRFLEFCMGCVAATTIETRVHWAWPALSWAFFAVFYVGMFYTTVFVPHRCEEGLWSFLWSVPFTNYCMLDWAYKSTTKFAFAWALIIQWAAASEYHDVPGRCLRCLEESHLLQTLSGFSLALYLGHFPVYKVLMLLSRCACMELEWRLNTLFIAVYGLCYLFKVHLQPYLDRVLAVSVQEPPAKAPEAAACQALAYAGSPPTRV